MRAGRWEGCRQLHSPEKIGARWGPLRADTKVSTRGEQNKAEQGRTRQNKAEQGLERANNHVILHCRPTDSDYITDALCFVNTSKRVEEVPAVKPFASWMVIDAAPMKDSMPAQVWITMPNVDHNDGDVICTYISQNGRENICACQV